MINKEDETITIGLFELIDAFQKILQNQSSDKMIEITPDRMSVKDKISQLIDCFEKKRSITLDELFAGHINKSEIIITFLSVLEMVKLSLIKITQNVQTGIIRLFYL